MGVGGWTLELRTAFAVFLFCLMSRVVDRAFVTLHTLRAIRNCYKDTGKTFIWSDFTKNAMRRNEKIVTGRYYDVCTMFLKLYMGYGHHLFFHSGAVKYHITMLGLVVGFFSFVFSWEHLREPHGQV